MNNPLGREKVLLLGVDSPIGLTVLRELGNHGLEVYGVARSDRGVGLYSRWLSRGYVLNGPRSEQLPGLLRILKEESIPTLMAVSEGDLLWLDSQREAFAGVQLLIPDHPQLVAVLDKSRVYEAAERVGVPVPRTFQPDSVQSVKSAGLRFPVVMKWADPNGMVQILDQAGIGLSKFEYAYDEAELEAKLSRFEPVGAYPLVQEFCPGYGLGQMFLMHKGEVGLYFQHRRVHEWPPEGGSSTLCVAVPPNEHAELREKSLRLLRELGWDGVAMVEYRFDPDSGRTALMEINGRFWGSQPLSSHAGAEFAWQMYRLKVRGEAPVSLNQYRTGFSCVYMIPELKRLAIILLAPGRIQNRALRFSRVGELAGLLLTWLNPATRYFVFRWSDPRPFFADVLMALRDTILRRG